MEPWGTPFLQWRVVEILPSTRTAYVWLWRYKPSNNSASTPKPVCIPQKEHLRLRAPIEKGTVVYAVFVRTPCINNYYKHINEVWRIEKICYEYNSFTGYKACADKPYINYLFPISNLVTILINSFLTKTSYSNPKRLSMQSISIPRAFPEVL